MKLQLMSVCILMSMLVAPCFADSNYDALCKMGHDVCLKKCEYEHKVCIAGSSNQESEKRCADQYTAENSTCVQACENVKAECDKRK